MVALFVTGKHHLPCSFVSHTFSGGPSDMCVCLCHRMNFIPSILEVVIKHCLPLGRHCPLPHRPLYHKYIQRPTGISSNKMPSKHTHRISAPVTSSTRTDRDTHILHTHTRTICRGFGFTVSVPSHSINGSILPWVITCKLMCKTRETALSPSVSEWDYFCLRTSPVTHTRAVLF